MAQTASWNTKKVKDKQVMKQLQNAKTIEKHIKYIYKKQKPLVMKLLGGIHLPRLLLYLECTVKEERKREKRKVKGKLSKSIQVFWTIVFVDLYFDNCVSKIEGYKVYNVHDPLLLTQS